MNQNPESLMHADDLHEDEYDDFDNDETENKPYSKKIIIVFVFIYNINVRKNLICYHSIFSFVYWNYPFLWYYV